MHKDMPDMAKMMKWLNKVGYSANIEKLLQDYPEVKWQSFKDWAVEQNWSILNN